MLLLKVWIINFSTFKWISTEAKAGKFKAMGAWQQILTVARKQE